MISYQEFSKLELKVATIKEVKDHPNADKLYVLKIECAGEVRQLVAGIKRSYSKEELIDRQVVIVVNLAPAVLRGVESQGMLLAAEDKSGVSILTTDRSMESGSKVK